MAHSLSAKKRIRQSVARQARNRWRKDKIKVAVRAFDEAVVAGDKTSAAEKLKAAFSALDKVSAKGTVHKNTASRKKSRLARRLAKLA